MQRKWRRDWERSKASHKKAGLRHAQAGNPFRTLVKSILPPVAAAGILLSSMTGVYANPTGGTVTSGAGTIAESGNAMTVTQTTDKLGIDWQSFSIGTGEKVQFIQPGSNSIALNRVIGNNASSIYGQLTSNGQVFLINPNGVLFAPGAQVNVGGIVASTLNISDSDFQAGNYKFSGEGGTVVNQGTISAVNGGYVALLGSQVKNEGIIVAQQGTVALGAGKAVTLDLEGDGLLSLAVDEGALNASAANHNLIQADGGQVIMAAGAAKDLTGTVVNNSGIIRARSIDNVNGVIRLDGGTKGAVVNSGTLDASGTNAGETGGTVKVLGNNVILTDGAKVDVSGDAGGGTALIGGNYQGKGPEQNATNTTVAATATINADALTDGNGGKVVVWADNTTTFSGSISAQGGAEGGDGGSAEVSGKNKLVYQGTTDLRASQGQTGNLLLDPTDFTIAAAGGDMTGDALGSQLGTANVTILSSQGTDGTDGDINVNDAVSWSSANTLTLSAYRDVNVNANITGTGGGNLVMRADNTGEGMATLGTGHGTVIFGAGAAVSLTGGDGSANNISIYYNPISYNDAATQTKNSSDPANSYNPYQSNITGNLTTYMLVNTLTDLQNITGNRYGNYFLTKDIDASATRTWNNGAGFTPINLSRGIFDGDGHVIDGLYISQEWQVAALFNGISNAAVRNLGVTNVDITAGRNGTTPAGALVGSASNSVIDNCYSTGTITANGTMNVGGLVGQNYGYSGGTSIISNSYSTVTINFNNTNTSGSMYVGGLVGQNRDATITNSWAGGAVNVTSVDNSGAPSAGGLVGYNDGSMANIINSYSTGSVTVNGGGWFTGGLVGTNGDYRTDGSSITNCYSSSQVTATSNGDRPIYVGGLLGRNYRGNVTNSYSTGAVTGNGDSSYAPSHVGGLIGDVYSGNITNSYSTGTVVMNGKTNNTDDRYQVCVGGSIGFMSLNAYGAGSISGTYWDTDTSGQAAAVGGIDAQDGRGTVLYAQNPDGIAGLSTTGSSPFASNSYSGWDFDNTWYMMEGSTRPFLRWEYSTTITNAHQLQLMSMNLGANYSLGSNINMSGYNMSAGGFLPVGSNATPFTGTLEGNGYAINGLTITNSTAATVGLFGTTEGATISNVGLYDVNITGGTSGAYVGSLAGYFDGGSITNVYSTGSVSGAATVGGLVGLNTGAIDTTYTTAQVTGTGDNGKVGGLAGENAGQISNTYSSGAVGSQGVGSFVGGLVGYDNGGGITASYWDAQTSGVGDTTKGVGNVASAAGVTGLTTAELMDHTKYSGWDFENTWYMIDGYTRPFLRSEYTTIITNAHQLQLMALNLGASYGLGGNVDMSELTQTAGMWNTATGFVPIGSGDAVNGGTPFTGYFDGLPYTITGLTINNPAFSSIGLFGYTQGATLKNVRLTGLNITGGANNSYVGGLVGYSGADTAITNASAAGSVSGTGNVGGLTGVNDGSITNGTNDGLQVSGSNGNIGGLTGTNNNVITGSTNTAAVTGGANSNVGGLAGLNAVNASIASSHAAGSVNANGINSRAGGLAGINLGSITGSDGSITVSSVTIAGTVTSDAADNIVGGLVGENDGTITSSYDNSAGVVQTTGNATNNVVGGLVGKNTGTITGSRSTGAVTANGAGNIAGGLIGENTGSITSLYSTGTVTSTGDNNIVGGLVGNNTGTITNSYHNTGAVTTTGANSVVGGLAGENDSSIIGSYNTAAVTVSGAGSTVGGLVGKNSSGAATGDSITTSYNSGVVTSDADNAVVGGLVGENTSGGVTKSYNTGAVTGNNTGNILGGLVGKNDDAVTSSYNNSMVTANGADSKIGGLVGENSGSITDAYNSTSTTASNADNAVVGGLVGENNGTITNVYTISPTISSGTGSTVGALVGVNGATGNISGAYWNTETARQSSAVGAGAATGVQGLTIIDMMQSDTYPTWDLTNTWGINEGTSFPYLKWQFSGTPQFISGTVQGGSFGQAIGIARSGRILTNTATITDSGFYYLAVPSNLGLSSGNVVAVCVAGDPNYKANSIYLYESTGISNADLIKDTVIVRGSSSATTTASGDVNTNGGPNLVLNYTGSSGNIKSYDIYTATRGLSDSDKLVTWNNGLNITGDFWAQGGFFLNNGSLTATGDVTINNTGDFVLTKTQYSSSSYGPITAGGDISINTTGNFIITPGYRTYYDTGGWKMAFVTDPSLIAGGNVTIVAGQGFVNHSLAGANTIQLNGNGRWLIYTTTPQVYSSNELLYYHANSAYWTTLGIGPGAVSLLAACSDELLYDGRGGLTGDFTLWDTTYGQAVPATGNGFIFSAQNPALCAPTPTQLMRKEAVAAALSDHIHWLNWLAEAPATITDESLFLTIVDGGLSI